MRPIFCERIFNAKGAKFGEKMQKNEFRNFRPFRYFRIEKTKTKIKPHAPT
jgi:hypothetical protein